MKNPEETKGNIQNHLESKITTFELKASGYCNNAYYLETESKQKLIVKQEKEVQEFTPQNSLLIEAKIARKFREFDLSIPTSRVVFVAQNPDMYGYEYIEGDLLKSVWKELSEEERVNVCKKLGNFHAEIGQQISREEATKLGITIDDSSDVHPETLEEYEENIRNMDILESYRTLVTKAKEMLDSTSDDAVFQFIHNDAHHENILINDKEISGFIDYGNSEYGEVAKEFSRYIRDFPDYFHYIVEGYEEKSGNKLSYKRLVSYSCVSGFGEIVEDYLRGGEARIRTDEMVRKYRELLF